MMEINFDDALDTSAERIELLSKCTELQKYSSLPYIHQHIAILRALGWRVQISEHAKFDGSDYESGMSGSGMAERGSLTE